MKLKNQLPEPTKENPFAQLEFVFKAVADTKYVYSTKQNYSGAYHYYIKFLEATANYDDRLKENPCFFVKKYWDEFAFVKLHQYIAEVNVRGSSDYRTSYTITGHLSAIRQVLKYAYYHGLAKTEEFLEVSHTTTGRETNVRESYTKREYDSISNMLQQELKYIYLLLSRKGYQKTGVGKDPRIQSKKNRPRSSLAPKEDGWKNIDNLRWYFENEMNCQPLAGIPQHKEKHRSFFIHAGTKFQYLGGLNGIYKKWGVASLVTLEILMPLAVKLVSETGLNPESLWNLDVDCFQESHPLSGVPYIQYFKRRSKGEKELHLSLSGKNNAIREYRENQAKIIRKTIGMIKQLTEPIRMKAPEKVKHKLFLYESDSPRKFGEIGVINVSGSSIWCAKMVEKYNLRDDEEKPLVFNLARFRPTRITRLVELGFDFFEIQHEAGHANITTTLNYLSRNNLNLKAKQETNAALTRIHENIAWAKEEEPSYAGENVEQKNVIYKGILCDCKNPYNPPEEVSRLKSYQKGQACTRYNMCLTCPNVILFKKHLPLLVVYKKQVEMAMNTKNAELPNEYLYKQSLDVIESLFDPEISEFSESDIKLAFEAAEAMDDVVIDPVIYKPVI